MDLIKEVNYFNNANLIERTISHSELSLVIHQQEDNIKERKSLVFLAQKKETGKIELFENDIAILEILLNFSLGFKNFKNPFVRLKATEEMKQITFLLFSYYIQDKKVYSVDQVISLLVRQIIKVNSNLLINDQSFLKLVDFMKNNLDKTLHVIDFCTVTHLSESSVNRLCKDQVGITAMKLFRKLQCQEATNLLNETALTIQEISEKLGFKNSKHFSTLYRNFEGESPLEKRKTLKGVV